MESYFKKYTHTKNCVRTLFTQGQNVIHTVEQLSVCQFILSRVPSKVHLIADNRCTVSPTSNWSWKMCTFFLCINPSAYAYARYYYLTDKGSNRTRVNSVGTHSSTELQAMCAKGVVEDTKSPAYPEQWFLSALVGTDTLTSAAHLKLLMPTVNWVFPLLALYN